MKDEPNLHLTPYRMKHLTRSQRDQLMVLHRAGHKQREIADLIGVDQSSVSRELIRNSSLTGRYTANTAQKRAEKRRKEVDTGLPRWHDDTDLLGHVLNELRDGKSPEQIAGRMKQQEHKHQVSHQTIYDYISADKDKGGVLYKHLRYQGKKYKWRGFKKGNERIPGRRDISERPEEVGKKERYGDWETDLVVSCKKGSGALATFAERKSMFCGAIKISGQTADEMVRASNLVLGSLPGEMRKTMTHDNEKEICKHKEVSENLEIEVFCARPYRSCDRGLNEWTNRELRRFFPKGCDFKKVKQKEVDYAVRWLNNCPRKSLQYRTPKEVFEEQLEIMHLGL
jgi:IS30 family transposase